MILGVSVLVLGTALLCAALIVVLMPVLARYALARPGARSSHQLPTPQGGGIAVLAATLLAGAAAAVVLGPAEPGALRELAVVGCGALVLAVAGAFDDVRPLSPWLRLAIQTVVVTAVVLEAGPAAPILGDPVPAALENAVLIVGGVWFVNLVNFMDGLDWMTVSGFVPPLAALALLGVLAGDLPPGLALAAALLGALIGFAPFNKPVAGLFLGDVGSLPIGLIVGWLVLKLAGAGALAAAVLLVLYPVTDATLTLLRRLAAGEKIWQAHRTHFYQRATDNGFSVLEVSGSVFVLNCVLACLALATLVAPPLMQAVAVAAGSALVAALLWRFAHPRVRRTA